MKPVILQLLGGVFELIWIGAVIASIYFLYGALANDAPVYYLPWMIGVLAVGLTIVIYGSGKLIWKIDMAAKGSNP